MSFDIPMKTTGALDFSTLAGGNTPAPTQQNMQGMQNMQGAQNMQNMQGAGLGNQGYAQPSMGQNMGNMGGQAASQQFNTGNNMGGYAQNMGNQQVQNFQQPVAKKRPAVGKGVILKKGQKLALSDNGAALKNVKVCLGWDVLNQGVDLDASAFMLGADNRIVGDDWFVFYGQTQSPDGSVNHSGDSQGQGDGDDETISIALDRINQSVNKITFVVTIDEALERGFNFSMVANAYVRVVNADTNVEIARFTLSEYYNNVTSMVVGELYRHNGQWKFNPVGDGVAKDLAGLCEMYGVNVAG